MTSKEKNTYLKADHDTPVIRRKSWRPLDQRFPGKSEIYWGDQRLVRLPHEHSVKSQLRLVSVKLLGRNLKWKFFWQYDDDDIKQLESYLTLSAPRRFSTEKSFYKYYSYFNTWRKSRLQTEVY